MLVRGVIDHQLGDHAQIAAMRLANEGPEIAHPPVGRIDVLVVGDVVAVVAQRRGIERQQPQRGDAKILQIVELARQSLEIADAVVVRVEERLDVELIDDRVLVPERVRNREARCWAGEGQELGGFIGWNDGAPNQAILESTLGWLL